MSSPADLLFSILWNERLSLDGVPLKCSSCGGWFHELTGRFSPLSGTMRGSDLKLLSKYRECGWYDFPHEDWVTGENVQCPQCMVPYRIGDVVTQALAWAENVKKERSSGNVTSAEEEDPGPEEAGDYGEDAPPETIGDLASPGVSPAERPAGSPSDEGAVSIQERVLKMTWEKYTQAEIAKTCDISIYMVREIQNGRKV